MSNWYIGQKVIAIKDHSQFMYRRGQVFSVTGIFIAPCRCRTLLTIGLTHPNKLTMCKSCGQDYMRPTFEATFNAASFRPLLDADNEARLDAIEQEVKEPVYA